MYVPGRHGRQSAELVLAATPEWPNAQFTQNDSPELAWNLPEAHCVQLDAEAAEYRPAAQSIQSLAEDLPVPAALFPAAQSSQLVEPTLAW